MAGSLFELDEFKPYAAKFSARVTAYHRRRSYFDGSIYGELRALLSWFSVRASAATRPLYLPLARAVNLDAGVIPSGWTLAPDAATLAVPLAQLFAWSDWRTQQIRFLRYGASLGAVGLKIVNDVAQKRVAIQPISPATFLLAPVSIYSDVPALGLIVEQRDDGAGAYEYAEAHTAGWVRTYRDGVPTDFGGRGAAYPSGLDFIPLIETQHIASDDGLGESTFETVLPMLDEVNALATNLANLVIQHAEPQWAISGVDGGAPAAGGAEMGFARGGDNVWFIPDPQGKATALVAPIDVSGVLEFIREIQQNVAAGLPELAFDELRSKQQIATTTIELQLIELVVKIQMTRPNYDHGLAHAVRLAGRAAAQSGVRELAALDDEKFAFDPDREILPFLARSAGLDKSSRDVKPGKEQHG